MILVMIKHSRFQTNTNSWLKIMISLFYPTPALMIALPIVLVLLLIAVVITVVAIYHRYR